MGQLVTITRSTFELPGDSRLIETVGVPRNYVVVDPALVDKDNPLGLIDSVSTRAEPKELIEFLKNCGAQPVNTLG